MKVHRCIGLAVVLLTFAGCGPGKPPPTGEVYQGKHVSEWGDAVKEGPDAKTRLEAAKTLAKLGKEGITGHSAVQALHVAVKDEDPAVRGWAAVALVYAVRGTPFPVVPVARPVLKEAAEASDEELRAAASEMLERMPAASAGGGGPPGGMGKKQGEDDGPSKEKQPNDKKTEGDAPSKDKKSTEQKDGRHPALNEKKPNENKEGDDAPPKEKKSPADKGNG